MKQIITLTATLFFISTVFAQNEKFETVFTAYAQSNSSFNNPKIKEFTDKYAKIRYAICTQKIVGEELENKLCALFDTYSIHIKNMSANDRANYYKTIELLNKGYQNCIIQNNKAIALADLTKRYEVLYNKTGNSKINFENKKFSKFANEMQDLVFKQCTTNMTQDEYNKKSKKIRAKYVNFFKDVSKKDMENLALLYEATFIKCDRYTIDEQYSLNR